MKKFVKPELEIAKFNAVDIVTASGLLAVIFGEAENDDSYKIKKNYTDAEWSD